MIPISIIENYEKLDFFKICVVDGIKSIIAYRKERLKNENLEEAEG